MGHHQKRTKHFSHDTKLRSSIFLETNVIYSNMESKLELSIPEMNPNGIQQLKSISKGLANATNCERF